MSRRAPFVLLAVTVMIGLLGMTGCTSDPVSVEQPVAEESSGPGQAEYAAAFEALHPGFTVKQAVQEDDVWWMDAQSDDVPGFWIRGWAAPAPGGDVTVTVDGVEWSTGRDLQEVTENAGLMPGDMRTQFMQAVVDDVGIDDPEHPGGFVTSVSVVSNMDMRIGFTGDTGDYNLLDYELDLASGDWVPTR